MNTEPTVNSVRQGAPHKTALDDLRDLDWNRFWKAKFASRASLRRDASFWDGRAQYFAKSTETSYSDQLLALMKPEAHWTVLDMGCGSGTLAIPLAGRVASVTAVDFSREMLAVLRKRCAQKGFSNVKTIHGSWEENWNKLGIGLYDTAIASRSLVVDDLQASLLKLNAVARKRVYIVTVSGDGPATAAFSTPSAEIASRVPTISITTICSISLASGRMCRSLTKFATGPTKARKTQ